MEESGFACSLRFKVGTWLTGYILGEMVLQGNKAGLSSPKEPDLVRGLTPEVKSSLGLHISLGAGSIATLNEFVSLTYMLQHCQW